jgi:anti-sigma regulatory factor (Ser/Thr protein kinase)
MRTATKEGERRFAWSPLAAIVATFALLAFVCWLSLLLHRAIPGTQLPHTYFLIPIAFAASTLGKRGGFAATAVALVAARGIMVVTNESRWVMDLSDAIEYFGLALGSIIIVGVVGCLRTSLDDLRRANEKMIETDRKLIESEERRVAFNREVLLAVTGSRLALCDDHELRAMVPGEPLYRRKIELPQDVSETRNAMRDIIVRQGLLQDRMYDFEAATTEATTNALKHAGSGTAELYVDGKEVLVLVSDKGPGIAPADLARATLEKGFSTRVSLGMGFKMMWELADTLAVSTGDTGTTILIRLSDEPASVFEESLLDRYPTLDV